ncbi:hypothetical protein DFJ63DRAFT_185932 [Scheffersomyces coipomensis]|uniref:uncharacterized protein n=1 Tax=Scheffersomyces coipomensis TaxID=1788519 RepID=UPI00315D8594
MSLTLARYIQIFDQAVKNEDSQALLNCVSIHPISQDGPQQSEFNEPNDFDLYYIDEKFRPVIRSHLKLMKSVYKQKNIETSFQDLNELVNHMIRAGDQQTNWINRPLIKIMNELIAVYKIKQQKYPEDMSSFEFQDELGESSINGYDKTSSLEQLANTINKGFKLSLNDKNLELSKSKRIDIYYLLANLIRIYFKMNKLELAKSLEKALLGARFQLPNPTTTIINKKYSIIYLYYSSLLLLDEGEFLKSEQKLITCYQILTNYSDNINLNLNQLKKILLLLLPLRLYNHGKYPKTDSDIWERFPDLNLIYKQNLFKSIIEGNIYQFNQSISKFETIFLNHHLYLLIELLRQQCYLNLFRKTYKIIELESNESEDTTKQSQPHIVPINAFQLAYEYSLNSQSEKQQQLQDQPRIFQTSLDEIECLLATLITNGKVKGYLSHSNRCIVLSKNNPFPR